MNKVFIARSLDGFIAGKNGEIDWLDLIPNPDQKDMGYHGFIEGIDAIVMGRGSFEKVLSFGEEQWPYKLPLFVLSTTLKTIPAHLQGKVEILNDEIPNVLKHLHAKGYKNLYIDGGKTIYNFLKEDLIDVLIITTIPIILGEGIPLFHELPHRLVFEHVESKVLLDQLVQDHYKRKR